MTPEIEVEVVYATPARQARYRIKVRSGTTAREAIEASGVLRDFPEIDLERNRIGSYGVLIRPAAPLAEGDRVEILRPLAIDAKAARRQRAARKRAS